jgi:delta 1-pyrroline-5-carboxylate dehydrogenase
VPARHGRAALPAGRRARCAKAGSSARAASTRPWARTRRCSPTWCGRLLENGANTSFINQIADPRCRWTTWWRSRWRGVRAQRVQEGASACRHRASRIRAPLRRGRMNSRGMDLTDESVLHALAAELTRTVAEEWRAEPTRRPAATRAPERACAIRPTRGTSWAASSRATRKT